MTEGKYLEPFGFVNASAKIINKTICIFLIESSRTLLEGRKLNNKELGINSLDHIGVKNEKRHFLQHLFSICIQGIIVFRGLVYINRAKINQT